MILVLTVVGSESAVPTSSVLFVCCDNADAGSSNEVGDMRGEVTVGVLDIVSAFTVGEEIVTVGDNGMGCEDEIVGEVGVTTSAGSTSAVIVGEPGIPSSILLRRSRPRPRRAEEEREGDEGAAMTGVLVAAAVGVVISRLRRDEVVVTAFSFFSVSSSFNVERVIFDKSTLVRAVRPPRPPLPATIRQ